MRRKFLQVLLTLIVVMGFARMAWAKSAPYDPNQARGPVRSDAADVQTENRVHDKGNMWMNITNYGYFGNEGPGQTGALNNPCPPHNWAPQCEFPGGSGQQYLYRAALWVGALIVEEGYETKRVSVGFDGWNDVKEMYPGENPGHGIRERSTRPGNTNCLGVNVSGDSMAVSDQDFIATYTDTLKDRYWVSNDFDGTPHRPLGIKVTQTTYSFSQAFARDFILIDYEFENIATNFLKNLYVGLYVDSDVGPFNETEHHTDDICGFHQFANEKSADGRNMKVPIDVAYIADNDGRSPHVISGPFNCPNVSGTRVIRGPNPRLQTSFNWWISNADIQKDYGPSWASHCEGADTTMAWTRLYGTPMGDEHKYQVLSNGEFDFDQIMVNRVQDVPDQPIIDPTTKDTVSYEPWCNSDPSPDAQDIANGYDTRYLLSWGPLGVRDYKDESGRWIYRLNPGEKFNMTLAYVGGENFHNINHPQPTDQIIDSSLFDFTDLEQNAKWAKDVYDNRMTDTPMYDWGNDGIRGSNDRDGSEGDGILETGDGWYGEDVGRDGLYGIIPPGQDSVECVYFRGSPYEIHAGWYKGPDYGENNGVIDTVYNPALNALGVITEDDIIPSNLFYSHQKYGYWDMGWMSGNGRLDQGDGIPDFTGPPPPPIPALMHCVPNTQNAASHSGGIVRFAQRGDCYVGGLGYELKDDEVILRWSTTSSESKLYVDPFSRRQDFEGYTIYESVTNEEGTFVPLDKFDRVDYAYMSVNDSIMTYPVDADSATHLPPTALIFNGVIADSAGVPGTLKAVGNNTGFFGGANGEMRKLDDSTYEYHRKAQILWPKYYSVTAFDYGDQRTGLAPQETPPTANSVLLAPTGSPKNPVRVVPNPYRAYDVSYHDKKYQGGVSWENQNDGTREFYPQQDRRIEFMNLPDKCAIRIYTVAGDLVQLIPHDVVGDNSRWASRSSEKWDLNSRNNQQVVSGIYLFSVEDLTDGGNHGIQTGKFVIIR